jgi:gamma-glutamylcyclotransferase (GGCT)/AIG2-like uncharacterized protein YtfP
LLAAKSKILMNLFVYGTLAPGKPNEHILNCINGTWKKGTVRGQLFSSGWGAALGFPGIILDPESEEVEGLLFCSTELDKHWETLDNFEGDGYQRVLTSVLLENNEIVDAYIYELSTAGRK